MAEKLNAYSQVIQEPYSNLLPKQCLQRYLAPNSPFMSGDLPKRGKRMVAAVAVIKVLSLFKVIFQQIIDSFLELNLGIRKHAGGF